MTRRETIALLIAPALKADAVSDVWDVVISMASALAADDAPGFLKPVDPEMPGYSDLATNVRGLIQQTSVRSMISPLTDEGGESERTLQVDWELRMYPRGGGSLLSTNQNSQGNIARIEHRQQAVSLRSRRTRKKWQIVKLDPIAFFAPPDIL